MEGNCSICLQFSLLASANISKKTGKRLYRSWCEKCEKDRKTKWRLNNKDKWNKKSKEWSEKNKGKSKEIKKKWRDANKDKMKLAKRKWGIGNKEKLKAYVNMRKKRVKQATPKWLSEFHKLWLFEIYHLAQITHMQVDHIVPINNKDVCGLHVPWNLQLLTAKENYAKSNKLQ